LVSSTSKAHYMNVKLNFRQAMGSISKMVARLRIDLKDDRGSSVCGDLEEIADDAKQAETDLAAAFYTGLSPFSANQFVETVGFDTQGSLAEVYCRPKDAGTEGLISGEKTVPEIFSNNGPMYRRYKGKLMIVAPGDQEALQKAIQIIEKTTRNLTQAVQK
jgi:hypothetical protein